MTSNQGFDGNADIYGIGIRIGYYTQAASIWVANFYAQHEAPYLHTVTLLFLIALLVGVCALAKNPSEIHAVEPYMLMQVAYNTMYMGLWDQSPPELLIWELHLKKRLMVDFVWICLHGFDSWFWWSGFHKMKKSSGYTGNNVFFPYVGQVNLYGWISIPARIFNAYMLTYLCLDFFFVSVYAVQQQHMDKAISPARLKSLTSQWFATLANPSNLRRQELAQDITEKPLQEVDYDQRPIHRHIRQPSDTPTRVELTQRPISRSSTPNRGPSSPGLREDDWTNKDSSYGVEVQRHETDPPPYPQLIRTSTGLLKRGLMRWSSSKEHALAAPSPLCTPYEPTFEALFAASNLLQAATLPASKPKCFMHLPRTVNFLFAIPNYCVSLYHFLPALITNPLRPSILLAILSHAASLKRNRTVSYPKALTLALQIPSYRSLNSKDVVLASRLLLSLNPPLPPTRWKIVGLGWATFGACSILVIGTELTIQWNEIRGVQKLGSVGQLIPFCVGVGGLFRVVWAAVMEQERQDKERWCYFGRCNSADRRDEWKEASEGFQRCRDAFEKENAQVTTDDERTDV